MGVTQSYAGLVVCRFFLGLFEAGFVPGKMKSEAQWRLLSNTEQDACTLYQCTTPDMNYNGGSTYSFAPPYCQVHGAE